MEDTIRVCDMNGERQRAALTRHEHVLHLVRGGGAVADDGYTVDRALVLRNMYLMGFMDDQLICEA
jgi:hypothetical protein